MGHTFTALLQCSTRRTNHTVTMLKYVAIVLALVAVSAAAPRPDPIWRFFNRFNGFNRGTATGSANANVVSGQTSGFGGSSVINQLSASAGGSASNGGFSFNSASANLAQSNNIFGSFNNANTNAQSIQRGGSRFPFHG